MYLAKLYIINYNNLSDPKKKCNTICLFFPLRGMNWSELQWIYWLVAWWKANTCSFICLLTLMQSRFYLLDRSTVSGNIPLPRDWRGWEKGFPFSKKRYILTHSQASCFDYRGGFWSLPFLSEHVGEEQIYKECKYFLRKETVGQGQNKNILTLPNSKTRGRLL